MDKQIARKIETFFGQYGLRRFDKGEVLIHGGEAPEHIYYLISGSVKQYDISQSGNEVVLNVFKPPAFFPMSYALNETPNEYFFETAEEVELRQAPLEAARTFIKANPDVLYDLLARVYRGTDGLLGRLAHVMASNARSRVLYELVIACRRQGEVRAGGYSLNLSETDLAGRVGLSRETVSREMSKLKAAGLIATTNRHTQVADLAALEHALGPAL